MDYENPGETPPETLNISPESGDFASSLFSDASGSIRIGKALGGSITGPSCEAHREYIPSVLGRKVSRGWFIDDDGNRVVQLELKVIRSPTVRNFRVYRHEIIDGQNKTYFVHAADLNRVKIGRAVDVSKRLKSLQTGSPSLLQMLAVLNEDCEDVMHAEFGFARTHLEWFDAVPELVAFIKLMNPQAAIDPTIPRFARTFENGTRKAVES